MDVFILLNQVHSALVIGHRNQYVTWITQNITIIANIGFRLIDVIYLWL
jgi:hypothetical protein